jgi:SRSO17 transposase
LEEYKQEGWFHDLDGRNWTGWRRHVLLVILAFGYLTRSSAYRKKTRTAEPVA